MIIEAKMGRNNIMQNIEPRNVIKINVSQIWLSSIPIYLSNRDKFYLEVELILDINGKLIRSGDYYLALLPPNSSYSTNCLEFVKSSNYSKIKFQQHQVGWVLLYRDSIKINTVW